MADFFERFISFCTREGLVSDFFFKDHCSYANGLAFHRKIKSAVTFTIAVILSIVSCQGRICVVFVIVLALPWMSYDKSKYNKQWKVMSYIQEIQN